MLTGEGKREYEKCRGLSAWSIAELSQVKRRVVWSPLALGIRDDGAIDWSRTNESVRPDLLS